MQLVRRRAILATTTFAVVGLLGACSGSNSSEPGVTDPTADDGIEWADITAPPDQLTGDAAAAKSALCTAQADFAGALTGLDSATTAVELGVELDRGLEALAIMSSNNAPGPVAADAAAVLPIWQRARTLVTADTPDADIVRVEVEAGFRFGQTRETTGRLRAADLTCT